MVSRTPRAEVSGLLSHQGEKSINFYFITVPLKEKSTNFYFIMVPLKEKSINFYVIMVPLKVLKYGTPKPSYSTLIETLIDPFKEP